MIERILELLKYNCITAKKLTDELKLSNSAVTDWKKGRAKPSTEAVVKIANYFNVSTDYILTGKDFINTNSCLRTIDKIEEVLLSNFRKLDKNNKRVLLYLIEALLDNNSHPDNLKMIDSILTGKYHQDKNTNIKHLPILGQSLKELPNNIIRISGKEYVEVPKYLDVDYAFFSLDDSMEPNINYEDLLFVKATPIVENSSISLVNADEFLTCRIYESYNDRIELKPINPNYRTFKYYKNSKESSKDSMEKDNYEIINKYKIIGKVTFVQDKNNNFLAI